jgi:hypothetical protein
MITTLLLTSAIIAMLLVAYLLVQAAARNFARNHPEFGPYQEKREGCCGSCLDGICHKNED